MIHPEFWARRRLAIPGGEPFELPATSQSALEDAGFGIIEQRQPSFLYDRSVLITGEVDRVTGFEKGFPVHQAWRGQGWEPDPLILDDQALIAHVAGRGLVVLTGCGHAGIINICRYAQRLTGVDKLHAVIGGFHLAGPLFEPVIADTVSALEQLAPEVIVPAHCTGWKATHAIARRLPGAFIQNSVGTTFHLTAAALRPLELPSANEQAGRLVPGAGRTYSVSIASDPRVRLHAHADRSAGRPARAAIASPAGCPPSTGTPCSRASQASALLPVRFPKVIAVMYALISACSSRVQAAASARSAPGPASPCPLATCWAYRIATSSGVLSVLSDPLPRVWRSAARSTPLRSARAVCPQLQ